MWNPRKEESKIAAPEREARCVGELLHWGSCRLDWLEGRKGEHFCLIAILDDATHEAWACFALRDSTTENMRLLGRYLSTFGRPARIFTNKRGLFHVNQGREARETEPLSRIGRALRDLEIEWSPYAYPRMQYLLMIALAEGFSVSSARAGRPVVITNRLRYPPSSNR